jgi:DNA-binding HxlR family transcriptional regulator
MDMCDPYESLSYPIDPTFTVLGRRWAPQVLFQIIGGTVRYSQLQRALPGISPRTLSVRVSEFESAGVISKNRKNGTECIYALTDKGLEVKDVLDSIASLSIRWHRTTPSSTPNPENGRE